MSATTTAGRLLVVGGVSSGVGKTTVTLALLEALRRRGLTVQAFKVGPDFIDPGFHEVVTGRGSYNLDGWMCGRDHATATVAHYAGDADLALVEGVMGCFDGLDGLSEDGSTAQMAKWLNAPVVLVLDAQAQARSAAAVVFGFEQFDPAMKLAAVIANRVGGETHARWIREAVAARCRARVVGAIPHDEHVALAERHLGLVSAGEGGLTVEKRQRLADLIERTVDLDDLLSLAAPLPVPDPAAPSPGLRRSPRTRIGIAHDAAFCFYYRDNLALLEAAGAELVYWSPLKDTVLPAVDGLYFGGGYPELYGATLAANRAMLTAVRSLASEGRPIYAECGGLMYLADAIEDLDGATHGMVGLLPATVRMRPRRLSLGYTEVTLYGVRWAASPAATNSTILRSTPCLHGSRAPTDCAVAKARSAPKAI